MAKQINLLLVGATGYIGGSVFTSLLASQHPLIRNLHISVLVRREQQGKVFAEKGVDPVYFKDLDDVDRIREIAANYDVIINTASGFHTVSSRALILGLGDRKASNQSNKSTKEVHYIHTSGTSNLADHHITAPGSEIRTFSDKDNIYVQQKSLGAIEAYSQRTTDITVIETGRKVSVPTTIIMSPTIYGLGGGLFNQLSIQIPTMIRVAITMGQAEMIGAGTGTWDAVHISDLVLLYELVLAKILEKDSGVPQGEKGILFSQTSEYTWRELSEGIARAGFKLGALTSEDVHEISLEQGAKLWSNGDLQLAELGFASNSKTRGDVSRDLGWKPQKTKEDFDATFEKEFEIILDERHHNVQV